MTDQKEILALAKKLWNENEEVATELANVIFGIRDGDYDKERGFYHGQPVYAWNNAETHQKQLKFYDAIHDTTFSFSGSLNGYNYENIEAIPTEHIPEWMYEAYQTLEGI